MTNKKRNETNNNQQASSFRAPLRPGDTETQTVGCRYTNPDICAKHSLPAVCAFVRKDGICLSPPKSWAKQYKRLKVLSGDS
ncbi:MAG: hypothetical protein JXA46_06980 [Dehalococcoidales bacterium]|nr:hypothetical protein [Dehalococcoidales bacterium]